MIRVAFGSVPKDGGTFTFYRNLRPALQHHGIELYCVTVGAPENRLWEEAYADSGCVRLAPRSFDLRRQARAVVRWCEEAGIDIVMGINSTAILSALPHLPERIRVMARCANGFDHGYRITLSGYDRLARIVALTPRLWDDLVRDYGADPALIELIPNGIAPGPFEAAAARPRGCGERLELGFLGRLEHNQKGVMHLPGIVAALNRRGVPFRLRIAGKGRHEPDLRRALAAEIARGQVDLLGAIGPGQVPDFLGQTDVFVFPSHFEGCPNALLEAMMAGTAPVSWHVEGITDFVLDDGRTGFLSPVGDVEHMAGRIEALGRDRDALPRIAAAAAAEGQARFSDTRAAGRYAELFARITAEPPPPWTPLPWTRFRPDPNFPQRWSRYVPEPAKNILQSLRSMRSSQ